MKQIIKESSIETPQTRTAILEVKKGRLIEMILEDDLYRIYSPKVEKEFRAQVNTESTDETLDEAKEKLRQLYNQDFTPAFTIPRSYIGTVLKSGLTPKLTYIPGLKLLAGTVGIQYYNPEEERRFLAILKQMTPQLKDQIKPRFTGPTAAFRGVISTESSIPLENLIIIDTKNMQVIYPENIEIEVLDEDKLVRETRVEIRNIVAQ